MHLPCILHILKCSKKAPGKKIDVNYIRLCIMLSHVLVTIHHGSFPGFLPLLIPVIYFHSCGFVSLYKKRDLLLLCQNLLVGLIGPIDVKYSRYQTAPLKISEGIGETKATSACLSILSGFGKNSHLT